MIPHLLVLTTNLRPSSPCVIILSSCQVCQWVIWKSDPVTVQDDILPQKWGAGRGGPWRRGLVQLHKIIVHNGWSSPQKKSDYTLFKSDCTLCADYTPKWDPDIMHFHSGGRYRLLRRNMHSDNSEFLPLGLPCITWSSSWEIYSKSPSTMFRRLGFMPNIEKVKYDIDGAWFSFLLNKTGCQLL
jgi:hypothetical protein